MEQKIQFLVSVNLYRIFESIHSQKYSCLKLYFSLAVLRLHNAQVKTNYLENHFAESIETKKPNMWQA